MAEPARENASYYENVRAILALDVSAGAKVVLIYLYDKQGGNGYSWPSLSTICRDCKMARATVTDCIRMLKKRNLLESKRPKKPSAKATTHYTVRLTSPKIKPVRKLNQFKIRTTTSPKIEPQPVRKLNSNDKDNGSLNDSQGGGKISKAELSGEAQPADEAKAAYRSLLRVGVDKEIARQIVYDQHAPLRSVLQAIENAELEARDVAAYVVGSLNQARNETHAVTPSKAAKKKITLAARVKRDSDTPPLEGEDLEKRRDALAEQAKALQGQG